MEPIGWAIPKAHLRKTNWDAWVLSKSFCYACENIWGSKAIVGIQKEEHLAFAALNPLVHGFVDASVWFAYKLQLIVRMRRQKVDRLITGCTIYDDMFKVRIVLAGNGLKSGTDRCPCIATDRNNGKNKRDLARNS